MGLTSRKKRPLNREIPHLRDTKLYVIATEGQETEPQYFSLFGNFRIQIKVIRTEDSKSSPEYILERLKRYIDDFQIEDNDELWLVVDVDRWGDEKLSQVCQSCSQKGFFTAVSNPCFDLWLYLHHIASHDLPTDRHDCNYFKDKLRSHLGSYNSSRLELPAFLSQVPFAIKQAKQLHVNQTERWPNGYGSHVYQLVEKLITITNHSI